MTRTLLSVGFAAALLSGCAYYKDPTSQSPEAGTAGLDTPSDSSVLTPPRPVYATPAPVGPVVTTAYVAPAPVATTGTVYYDAYGRPVAIAPGTVYYYPVR